MTVKAVPLRFWLFVAGCVGTATSLGWLAVRVDGHFEWQAAIIFGILCFVAEQYPVTLPQGSYSVGFVITIAAIIAVGPGEAALATLGGTTDIWKALKGPYYRHFFNASQLTITAALAGLAYWFTGGTIGTTEGLLPDVLPALGAATIVDFVINTALVSVGFALRDGVSPARIWRDQFSGLRRGYLAFALLGLLLGVLYLQIGWPSVLFLLMPLLVARHAFQAAVEWQRAYDDTAKGLVKAIEAKDPYTRGHAERVSRLSEMTARAYGLTADEVRAIRYAALMHDVGKLGVDSAILQKPGKLTPEEYEHMKQHPLRGLEIVGEIDLLGPALVGVRHHHERLDGGGYPDGLRGDEIPLFARIIMVSDAFDSMTSTRTYRKAKTIDEAFIELRRCAGTQFDIPALGALEKAVAKNGWTPAPEAEEAREGTDARVASL